MTSFSSLKQGGYVSPVVFPLWRSVWGVMRAALSMCELMRSSVCFSSRISSMSQSYRVSLSIFTAIYSLARTGSPVSVFQVVLLILYFSNGENNYRIGYPCSL